MIPVGRHAHLNNERRQLREAAQRLLTGAPQHSNGGHTVSALAAEAGVSRQRLYEHHAEFVAEFKTTTGLRAISPNIQALQQQLADSRERIRQLQDHATSLQNRIRTLGAVITELTLEAQAGNVVPLAQGRRRATTAQSGPRPHGR